MIFRQIVERLFAVAVIVIATHLISGCPSANTTSSGDPKNTPAAKPFKAALALDIAGVDDKSFNAASWSGLRRSQKELNLDNGAVKYVEARDPSDYRTNLASFAAQGYDLVFAGSYAFDDALIEVSSQFPKTRFAIIDGNPSKSENTCALNFREEQGTFLAGYLASLVSNRKRIGFIGGKDIPLIKKFEAGYRAGAKTANPSATVITTYTGDWNDVGKGKAQADQQFGNGVDIVFHAAGKAGLGVIQSAKEHGTGFYAIGVDSDQDGIAPGRVLTSVLKRVDIAVFDTVKRARDGQFKPGRQVYDLKSGGVALTEMRYTRGQIKPDVLAKLAKMTKAVSDGEVVPPTTLEELRTWRAVRSK